jgi:FtsH-binding integral membrane protein
MYILEAMTGFVVLFVTAAMMVVLFFIKNKSIAVKSLTVATIILIPVAAIFYAKHEASKIFRPFKQPLEQLDLLTANKNPYFHSLTISPAELPYLNPKMQENGNPLCIYLNAEELKKAWNERSELDFDGKDLMGHEIKYTISRYLSSKGLRKDSIGVYSLSQDDVRAIENSIPNVEYKKMGSLKIRLHKTIMEYYSYKFGDNPSGRSMLRRIEFWKAGANIFLQQTFDKEYERINSPLSEERRFRAHNQYLTFALTFGIFGLLYFIFYMLFPFFKMKKQHSYFYSCFLMVAALSMFTEDTLETQAGVTYFIFFNCFFLFLQPQDSPSKKVS